MPRTDMDPRAAAWFGPATSRWQDWPVPRLRAAKGTQRISVIIPARDEQATIGSIVAGIRAELMAQQPLVDELIVIDSDSVDDTAALARAAGAVVHRARDIRPELGSYRGKGEAIWKSLFVASGDLLVYVDADLTGWGPHFVSGLLGPLLHDPRVRHVKGFYDRRVGDDLGPAPAGPAAAGAWADHRPQGGRVTELVARPLLNLRRPELSAVVQPLAGEWAVRRATLAGLALPVGYGVEIAVLLDVCAAHGLDALAQVDLGERAHSHQAVHDLGVMATEIIETVQRRLGTAGTDADSTLLWQYDRASTPPWRGREVPLRERPAASSIDQPC